MLFVLSLEAFLHRIKDNPNISSVQTGQYQHKVAAFADNLLFFITKPSLPWLLQELKWYGPRSKFKVSSKSRMR